MGFYIHTGRTLCSSYECAPVYFLQRLSKWLAQIMTLPACISPPYDPLRKVLQQVAIPAAYVTILVAIIPALFSLVALLVAAGPCTAVCEVTRISVLAMGAHQCVAETCRRSDSNCQPQLSYMWWGFTATCFGPCIRSLHQNDLRNKNCKVQHRTFIYPVHIYGWDPKLQLSQNSWPTRTFRRSIMLRPHAATTL